MSTLTWGRVLALSIAYLLVASLAGALLFRLRLHNDVALHKAPGTNAGVFFALWVAITFVPPLWLAGSYARRQRRQVQFPPAAG